MLKAKNLNYGAYTLVIPTLNEIENIPVLLNYALKTYPAINIIVSDDGSSDGTREFVSKLARRNNRVSLLDRSARKTKGLTASVTDALALSRTAYAIVIDGDMQHPPEKIGEMAEGLENADLVIATRKRVLSRWPLHRKIVSKAAILLAQMRLSRQIKDPVSGFFGIRTSLFQRIYKQHRQRFQPAGYKVLFDILKYIPRNARIAEVYYNFGARKGGASKIRFKHIAHFFRSLFN